MEIPFEFIECKITERDEFELTYGKQPTYALFYLKKGSFKLKIDESETVLNEGDCAIFSDDIDFSRSVIEPISFVYLKFRKNPKSTFTFPLSTGKVDFIDRERFMSNIRAYERIMDDTDARSLYIKEHLLGDIILQLYMESKDSESISDGTEVDRKIHDLTVCAATEYIRSNIAEKISIGQICRAVGTNTSTLNFKFRKELSCSVGEWIYSERMLLARRLLAGTTFSIGEIAIRCGYENIYYFSSAFRKAHGTPPSAFRERYR